MGGDEIKGIKDVDGDVRRGKHQSRPGCQGLMRLGSRW